MIESFKIPLAPTEKTGEAIITTESSKEIKPETEGYEKKLVKACVA